MPEQNFHAVQRLREFWTILKSPGFRSKTTLFLFATWLISILLILLSPNLNFRFLLHALHLFLLFKLTQNIDRNLRPQPELLLPFFFLFFLLEIGLLKAVYAIASPPEAVPGFFFTGLQGFVLAALLLIFSLLLVQNIRTSFWSFLLMFLLTYILLNLVDNEGFFYHILIQIILVIFLLRRTAWLELLTKNECWLYLFLLFLSFWAFSDLNPFADPTVSRYQEATIWFGLPKILYLGFKMYLLALLVKIPVVLVYNFASLSRKLKISSLFQSTFPQLIQLCMLLLMFYFFLAGWQAEKVRMAIIAKIEEIGSGSGHREIPIFKFPVSSSDWTLSLKGYQPIQFRKTLPDQGVLTIPRLSSPATANAADGDYFIFFESREADTLRYLNIVKLDSMFLQALSERTSILAGSLLQAYPYQPPLWESYLYDFSFLKDESRFWIFPFGVIPARPDWSVSCALVKESETSPEWARNLDQKILRHIQMNVGRVVSPLLAADMSRAGLFAFDIILTPRAAFFTTSMLSYILLLIVVYLLVNALVIGRMAKFGEEINQMIVQKFNQLKSGIREIATGNLDYQVKIEGRDEFVELADRFNTMGVQLKESIAKAREKERLEHELAIARQVQRDLLPRTLPNIPGFRVAAALKTANEVGGDFYDLLALDDHLFLFTIGDVSGKGTSAAFYMAQCISLIRFSPQFTCDPQEIVLRINKYFSDPLIDRQVFVTAVVAILDTKKNEMQLVRAGHNPPILISGKTTKDIEELKCDGLGIGIERNGGLFEKNLKPLSLRFQAGDTILFYTDGFVEAASTLEKAVQAGTDVTQFYGEERLHSVLRKNRGTNPSEFLNILKDDIELFYAGRPLVDDYTLLILQKTE